MATLYMLMGIPGSGKSTYAKNILIPHHKDAVYIASDVVRDLHPDIKEDNIWDVIYDMLSSSLKEGKDVIYDATNFNRFYRDKNKEELKKRNVTNFELVGYFFTTDRDVCIERVKIRNHLPTERFLPTDVIASYQDRLEFPTYDEGFKEIHVIDNTKENKKYKVVL